MSIEHLLYGCLYGAWLASIFSSKFQENFSTKKDYSYYTKQSVVNLVLLGIEIIVIALLQRLFAYTDLLLWTGLPVLILTATIYVYNLYKMMTVR